MGEDLAEFSLASYAGRTYIPTYTLPTRVAIWVGTRASPIRGSSQVALQIRHHEWPPAEDLLNV